MVWFKVDDDLWSHPKVEAAGLEAMGLWLLVGSYCGRYLTDGLVPASAPRKMGDEGNKLASRLVRSGLWEDTGDEDKPWRFHDWLNYNPSKASVLMRQRVDKLKQALNRDPQLRGAIKDRDGEQCRFCGKKVNFNDGKSDAGGTYDHLTPTSQGGQNTADNLVVACRTCNTKKGGRTPTEAGMELLPPRGSAATGATRGRAPRSAPRSLPRSDLGQNPGAHGVTPGRVGTGTGRAPRSRTPAGEPDNVTGQLLAGLL